MTTDQTPPFQAESTRDVLDVLSTGIAKLAAWESTAAPLLPCPQIPAKPACQLLTEKMLADLAGQNRENHKPPEVLKSQVFCFWCAGGIRTSGQDIAGIRYFRKMLDHSRIE